MLIAQISDIHASAGNANLEAWGKAVAWLNTLAPDAVIITGDIVGDGWATGYDAMLDRLSVLDCPVFALPDRNLDARVLLGRTEHQTLAQLLPHHEWPAPLA
ncbi:metallophosphoesterase family protein [Devosia lacusdianchii]|uniref:metallophosphoesterase family protein n=1 Tax=Devosia lacusdianchii TaxID=2917991 RepID=UPI001F070069|nr:metallophosphoesterase [Devosia sp. JXJ CY 41]